jgi:septal ring factor EnvC (AmiA/AmiB activator)
LARAQNGNAARTSTAKEAVNQMRLFTPDADFVMKLNSLEQQLAHSREDNKQLRRRIADGHQKVEAEQGDKPSAQGCINSQR